MAYGVLEVYLFFEFVIVSIFHKYFHRILSEKTSSLGQIWLLFQREFKIKKKNDLCCSFLLRILSFDNLYRYARLNVGVHMNEWKQSCVKSACANGVLIKGHVVVVVFFLLLDRPEGLLSIRRLLKCNNMQSSLRGSASSFIFLSPGEYM